MSWESVLDMEAINFFVKTTFEEEQTVVLFFNLLKERVEDYQIITSLAKKWDTYDASKQARIAINYAGIYHASRFIILMDYLNMKSKKGEL